MRFVVLHHTDWPGRPDHYDLMLQFAPGEDDDSAVLKTFATTRNEFPSPLVPLKKISDHRRAYLELQGPVGGDRGQIARLDGGELRLLSPAEPAWQNVRVEFFGQNLRGVYQLRCAGGSDYVLERVDEV